MMPSGTAWKTDQSGRQARLAYLAMVFDVLVAFFFAAEGIG